jgi:hypothetical protein
MQIFLKTWVTEQQRRLSASIRRSPRVLKVFSDLKSTIFWDIRPCSDLKVNRRFGGTCHFQFRGRRIRRAKNQRENRWHADSLRRNLASVVRWHPETRPRSPSAAATCSRWFLARGFFYPEDGGDTFLRNVGSHMIYTAPHPRRRNSSLITLATFRAPHFCSIATQLPSEVRLYRLYQHLYFREKTPRDHHEPAFRSA